MSAENTFSLVYSSNLSTSPFTLNMSKQLPNNWNNLLNYSLKYLFGLQRFFGVLPIKIEKSELKLTMKSLTVQLLLPIVNTCMLLSVVICTPSVFNLQGNLFRKSAYVAIQLHYFIVILLANYKKSDLLGFYKRMNWVDDILGNNFSIFLNNKRIIIILCFMLMVDVIQLGPKICLLLTEMNIILMLTQFNRYICVITVTINSLAYFINIQILFIRSKALRDYVRKLTIPNSLEDFEQILINIFDVHNTLRNSVSEFNQMYGKRVTATYLKEAYIITIQFMHIYSMYMDNKDHPEFTSIIIDTILRCIFIAILSLYCHLEINMVTELY